MITLTSTAAQEVKRLIEKEQKPNLGFGQSPVGVSLAFA